MSVKFNANRKVKFKLQESFNWTRFLREKSEELGEPQTLDMLFGFPDENGYREMQFWEFMEILGPYTHMTSVPFYPTIILETPDADK